MNHLHLEELTQKVQKVMDQNPRIFKSDPWIQLQTTTSLPGPYLLVIAVASVLLLVILVGGTSLLCDLAVLGLPAALTAGAITKAGPARRQGAQRWLTYWTVATGARFADRYLLGFLTSRIPFFFLIKTFFFIWCYHPQTQGASAVYEELLRPHLLPLLGIKAHKHSMPLLQAVPRLRGEGQGGRGQGQSGRCRYTAAFHRRSGGDGGRGAGPDGDGRVLGRLGPLLRATPEAAPGAPRPGRGEGQLQDRLQAPHHGASVERNGEDGRLCFQRLYPAGHRHEQAGGGPGRLHRQRGRAPRGRPGPGRCHRCPGGGGRRRGWRGRRGRHKCQCYLVHSGGSRRREHKGGSGGAAAGLRLPAQQQLRR
ncbi:unnamed protein product, partial [Heterosigma akashiwo]